MNTHSGIARERTSATVMGDLHDGQRQEGRRGQARLRHVASAEVVDQRGPPATSSTRTAKRWQQAAWMGAVGVGDQAVDRSASAATSGPAATRNSPTWSPSLGAGLGGCPPYAGDAAAVDLPSPSRTRTANCSHPATRASTASTYKSVPTGRGAKWSSSPRTPTVVTPASARRHRSNGDPLGQSEHRRGGQRRHPAAADRGGGFGLGHGVPEGRPQSLRRTASTR
jgi:hypothetical protein